MGARAGHRDRVAEDEAMDNASAPGRLTEIATDPYGLNALFDYRRAAVRLVAIEPELARPVLYLSRHALELALKFALSRADLEYHFGSEAKDEWPGHGLAALMNALNFRLAATGNPPLPATIKLTISRLNDLDPDGQRSRYAMARRRDGSTEVALPKGTKVDLAALVENVETAVVHLVELRPSLPRTRAQHARRLAELAGNQAQAAIVAPDDFGVRRALDGSVVLPRSAAPHAKAGDALRVLSGGLETSQLVTREEDDDLVLEIIQGAFRIPIKLRTDRRAAGTCPECGADLVETISEPQIEPTVVWDPGVVHA